MTDSVSSSPINFGQTLYSIAVSSKYLSFDLKHSLRNFVFGQFHQNQSAGYYVSLFEVHITFGFKSEVSTFINVFSRFFSLIIPNNWVFVVTSYITNTHLLMYFNYSLLFSHQLSRTKSTTTTTTTINNNNSSTKFIGITTKNKCKASKNDQ